VFIGVRVLIFYLFFSLSLILVDTDLLDDILSFTRGDAAAALSDAAFYTTYIQSPPGDNATALVDFALSAVLLLWTPAQRKRASMLYFANVFF